MIYLLETSRGSWDHYERIIIGAATDAFEADKLKQKWLVKLKKKQLEYSEEQQKQYDKDLKDYDLDVYIPEYLDTYLMWYYKAYNDYSNQVIIKEIKENTIICNNLKDWE